MRKPIVRVIATGAQRAARRVRWWLAALAVALPLLVAFPGTANAITGCPGGDPSAQHCYAFGYFGDDVGGAPVWMDAVATDLTAY